MICPNCGKILPDDSLFCDVCGNKIDEKIVKQIKKENKNRIEKFQKKQQKEQRANTISDIKATITDKELRRKKKEERKSKRKPVNKVKVIISSGIIVVLALAASYFLFIKGRSLDKTIDLYLEAYHNSNSLKKTKLMFPRKALDEVTSSGLDESLVRLSDELFYKYDTFDLELVKKEDPNEKLKKNVEAFLDSDGLGIDYQDIQVIYLSDNEKTSDKDDSAMQFVAYKEKNKWYIIPGLMEYIIDKEQEEDVNTAYTIENAIHEALADEEVYKSLTTNYLDIGISLQNDMDYLPEHVKEKIMENLKEIPEIKCDELGACGFAFKVTYDDAIEVYISSDQKVDEWQVYPDVTYDYYDGIKNTDAPYVDSGYSYAALISSKSPILGHWTSDEDADMYIGYSESGGDEGFTVYFQSEYLNAIYRYYVGFEMLNANGVYTQGFYNGKLTYSDDIGLSFEISVLDSDKINVYMEDRRYSPDDPTVKTYHFKKGEMSKNLLTVYEGEWYIRDSDASYDSDTIKLSYCDTCGCVHTKDDADRYHNDKLVVLFDGKILNYIFPSENFSEGDDSSQYENVKYTLDGIALSCLNFYVTDEDIDCIETNCYKADSDEAKIIKCLNAYKELAEEIPAVYADNTYCLVDVNNDDILELFVKDAEGIVYFCSYHDGTAMKNAELPNKHPYYTSDGKVIDMGGGSMNGEYIMPKRVFEYDPSTGGFTNTHTFEMTITDLENFRSLEDPEAVDYTVDGTEYDTYEEASNKFDSFYDDAESISSIETWYDSIDAAYQNVSE